jgi:hypothetical protein
LINTSNAVHTVGAGRVTFLPRKKWVMAAGGSAERIKVGRPCVALPLSLCAGCACVRACVHRACVRACVRARARTACVRARDACVHALQHACPCMRACMRVCVCMCVCVCCAHDVRAHACVRACVRACACVRVCVPACVACMQCACACHRAHVCLRASVVRSVRASVTWARVRVRQHACAVVCVNRPIVQSSVCVQSRACESARS